MQEVEEAVVDGHRDFYEVSQLNHIYDTQRRRGGQEVAVFRQTAAYFRHAESFNFAPKFPQDGRLRSIVCLQD